jgi:hypothetical protein
VQAINANAAARALVVAVTYRGSAGGGIVQARAQTNLSDFLDPRVQNGPFEYSVMRIGKRQNRDGSKTGVFLYCQQHAREWATPLTCLETAKQLLTNYAIDKKTREFVDNLDIFILPVSNPDGSNYSFHNFNIRTTACSAARGRTTRTRRTSGSGGRTPGRGRCTPTRIRARATCGAST